MITPQTQTKEKTGLFIFGAQQTVFTFNLFLVFLKPGETDPLRVVINAQGRTETDSLATSPTISRTSALANLSETSNSLKITPEPSKLPVFGLLYLWALNPSA